VKALGSKVPLHVQTDCIAGRSRGFFAIEPGTGKRPDENLNDSDRKANGHETSGEKMQRKRGD